MGIVLTSIDRALPASLLRLRRDTIPPHDPSGPFADHPCVVLPAFPVTIPRLSSGYLVILLVLRFTPGPWPHPGDRHLSSHRCTPIDGKIGLCPYISV